MQLKKKKSTWISCRFGPINMSHEFASLEVPGQLSMDSVAPSSRGPHSWASLDWALLSIKEPTQSSFFVTTGRGRWTESPQRQNAEVCLWLCNLPFLLPLHAVRITFPPHFRTQCVPSPNPLLKQIRKESIFGNMVVCWLPPVEYSFLFWPPNN